jgi:hypothetical protein
MGRIDQPVAQAIAWASEWQYINFKWYDFSTITIFQQPRIFQVDDAQQKSLNSSRELFVFQHNFTIAGVLGVMFNFFVDFSASVHKHRNTESTRSSTSCRFFSFRSQAAFHARRSELSLSDSRC